jgi:CPA2 family monovalent cation:H+ antiporter-2
MTPLRRRIAARPRLAHWLDRGAAGAPDDAGRPAARQGRHRAIVVGYGPTGRTVVRLLRENRLEPTVVDLNVDAVRVLREAGVDAVYGDASRPDTLQAAGMDTAGILVLASAGLADAADVIRQARDVNPGVRIVARAEYLRDLPALRHAGADTVYAGESEVALAFVEDILQRLGATAEQIDRERERAHRDLVGEN